MIVLVLIGFLGGLVTGISPCILPVLPVIFATGAASGISEDADEPEVAAAMAATPGADGAALQQRTDALSRQVRARTRCGLPASVVDDR